MIPKIRAWIEEEKKIVKVGSIEAFNENYVDIWDDDFKNTYYEVTILMQSTGVKDKNGKEIFEGDIVRYEGYLYRINYHPYIKGAFILDGIDNGNTGADGIFLKGRNYCNMLDYLEVIGNIYENPELLEVEE